MRGRGDDKVMDCVGGVVRTVPLELWLITYGLIAEPRWGLLESIGLSDIDAELAERFWQELKHHRVSYGREMCEDELDAVVVGIRLDGRRGWLREGCAASYEPSGWCWPNDQCKTWDVTYYFDDKEMARLLEEE